MGLRFLQLRVSAASGGGGGGGGGETPSRAIAQFYREARRACFRLVLASLGAHFPSASEHYR